MVDLLNSHSGIFISIFYYYYYYYYYSISDGSHKGTNHVPIKYEATETKKVYFCGCKQSANKPCCDGSHKKLPEDANGKAFPVDYLAGV